jgi:hypothetical protein
LTVSGLSAGGSYLVPGLPAGVVRVTDAAGTTDVDVSTDPTSHDVTLPCADMTSPPETTSPDAAAT